MKTIQIKSLSLVNFKGIRKLEINDFQKETNIFGANGTGKTTIMDAFTFLLFGKDSSDRTAFEIKTLDKNNNVIPQIDHEVEAVILVDGEEINIKRTFREKWVKRRGSSETEFQGNETLYEWNNVPMTLRDYSAKISNIVDESVFKLITSPSAFNSLKWQDQRQVLIDISGGVTDEDVAKGNSDFEKLLLKLTNKSLEEYQKQIASSIRKSKDEIKMIPTRIDEVQRGKPEPLSFDRIRKLLTEKLQQIASVDNQISDKVEAQQEVLNNRQAIQKDIYQIESDIAAIKQDAKLKAQEQIRNAKGAEGKIKLQIEQKEAEFERAKRALTQLENVLKNEQGDIELLTAKNNHIRDEWNKRNAEEFKMDEDACKCPTCERAFEAEDVEAKKKEFFANFQQSKMKDLEELSAKGKRNKEQILKSQEEVKILEGRVETGKSHLEALIFDMANLQNALDYEQDNTEVKPEAEIIEEILEGEEILSEKENQIQFLKEEMENLKGVDIADLKTKKETLNEEVGKLKQDLLIEDQIKAANARIESLQKEESELAQQIANYEKDQFTIEQFVKAKIEKLESLINDRFELVNFKLFEEQVNGAQVPTCKAMVNGVPYSDLNTASRINSGIDIINTLNDYYSVSSPIWIDNRESISRIIPSKSQIINLIVSESDKKLRVESANVQQLETV